MKKYFYSVLAASMLFACSQEDIVDVTKGEGQMKTFKVEIPKVESRTVGGFEIGAGVQADNLIYAMYENGKEEVLISGVVTDGDNGADDGTFTVTVPMAKDLKYDLLFLAYNASNSAFNIASDAKETDLKALQFKDKQTANIDAFDAFVGSLKAHGVADANDVTLKRPFAQINAATSAEDMKNATTLKLDVTKSSLVIKGVPASYNVLEGTASSNTIDVTYAANTIPVCDEATTDPKNEQLSVDGTNYYYLTLAYALAGEVEKTSTHNATFQFLREDGTSVSTLEIVSLPIQRNYRTNVIGDLLTKSEEYTIKIDANFGGDHNLVNPESAVRTKVSSAEELKKAITAAKEDDVIVLADGTYEGEFDLTHKKLTIEAEENAEVTIKGMVWADDCTVTLKGLALTNPDGVQHPNPQNSQYYTSVNNQYPVVGAYNKANITFEECTFELTTPTIYGFYGYAHNNPKFKGCTFNCNKIRPIASNGPSMEVTGCTFKDQYHYSVRIFENQGEKQTVVYTNNTVTGSIDKGEFEGINISKKGDNAIVLGEFTIKDNTEGLKFRHHKNVTMSTDCTYDTDIENFAFEKEQD